MDLTFCTAIDCPMAYKCYRKYGEEPDNPEQSYINYEYFCNENSGFDMFVSIHTEGDN